MVQLDAAKDLAAMFNPPQQERYSGFRYGQGTILTWNPATFENTVSFRSLTLTNLPILGKIDGLSLKAGDVVGLMGWAPNGGFGAWWILGELGVPPLANPVAVEGGANFLVRDGGEIRVLDGGDIILQGGTLRAIDISGTGDFVEIDSDGNGEIRFGSTASSLGALIRWLHVTVPPIDALQIQSDSSIGITAETSARLQSRDITTISALDGGSVHISPSGGSGAGDIGIQMGGADSEVNLFYQTTGSSANMHVGGTSVGLIRRSTSGARYKQDIEDLVVDPVRVLDLKPRTWRDRGEVTADPETDRWHVGFVAEDVIDAGLSAFVDFTAEGEPDYVCYDRLSVALLALAQDQERRLGELEARMAALDGKEVKRPVVQQTHIPMRKEDPDFALPAHDDERRLTDNDPKKTENAKGETV